MRFQDPAKAREFFEQKMTFTTGPVELNRMLKDENINVIDVRAAEDFAKGHIPSAVNLPKDKWDSAQGLKKDKINVLYCYSAMPPGSECRAGTRQQRISSHGIGRRFRDLEGIRARSGKIEADQRNISRSVSAFRGAAPSASLSK